MGIDIRSETTFRSGNISETLRRRAQQSGNKRAFGFLDNKGELEADLTFAELDMKAGAIASALLDRGLEGQRVLLLFPQGLDFIGALFGCFYAGAIAVPVPFMPGRRTAERLSSIAADAKAAGVLTSGDLQADRAVVPEAMIESHLAWIDVGALSAGAMPTITHTELAFLQYTSGSTGSPKGVMISHTNLLANCRMIGDAFGDGEDTCGVSWLPLFHDMGLVGHVLQPVYLGCTSMLMSPTTFLQRPIRWLEAISRWRGTTSGAPTTAYDLCVRMIRPEAAAELDLSSWRLAYCGSEKVRPAVLDRFATLFSGVGFRKGSLFPCYGLAEATLMVAGRHGIAMDATTDATLDDAALGLPCASCGPPPAGCRVVVVEPETRTGRLDGSIGEVWVSGPHVARGYWGTDVPTLAFDARLADGTGPFLRTGDLGFVRHGELFIVGRSQDTLVVNGGNHAAEDIEDVVSTCDSVFVGHAGAAFAVERRGREEAIVVQEVAGRVLGTASASVASERALAAVVARFGFRLAHIVLVRQGRLPRTTSGKVQRSRAKALYAAGEMAGGEKGESGREGTKGEGIE